ncbi:MAG: hypothetical protein COT73_01375 [Bdellovibrio sp. CG10_big_fil_rev_8_21_14_0_10_47_8]|nr:MAG: hypothetical protein COT73_01375 [Bdellovibrio sp. CG10_big_fil_rev_8_21_14_0_10_47_8]
MFSLRGLQGWTSVLLVLLTGSLVIFAYVARKPLCIDSRIVERIDSISDRGTVTAFRCGLHRQVDFDEVLASESRSLSHRLQILERFFDLIGPLDKRVSITTLSGPSIRYRVQDHDIYLSEPLLKASGQLEKSILKVWFRERASSQLQNQALIEESLTDLFYFAISGDLNLKDPMTGLSLDSPGQSQWPQVLKSFQSYCRSRWRSNEQLFLCGKAVEVDPDNSEIYLGSLRPLLSESLIGAFVALPAKERIPFLRLFAKEVSTWSIEEQSFGVDEVEPGKQSFAEASSFIERWMFSLSQLGKDPLAKKYSVLFSEQLERRGFVTGGQVATVPGLIFYSVSQMHIPGGEDMVDLQRIGAVQSYRGVYVHCGYPEISDLEKMAQKVERLLYINSCEHEEIDLEMYFQSGAEAFARRNKSLKFVEFHMPSLLMALRKSPTENPAAALAAMDLKSPFLQEVGWLPPQYHSGSKAYKAKAVIEAVDWYRL